MTLTGEILCSIRNIGGIELLIVAEGDYFRGYYRIHLSHLLYYNTLIVSFSYFFYKNQSKPNPVQDKHLDDNSIVHISNDWFRKANSKNYHHIFPKAYMKTHFIGDLNKFEIWSNDYDLFIHERAELISSELKKRIIKQTVDTF